MCRVDERIYISADGRESKFEESFPCDKAKNGRLCSKVKKRTTEYFPKKPVNPRHDPPTPTSTGSYNLQQIRPSSSSSRPSTRDGQKLIIEFGSSKKDNGKKYPSISLSTNAPKSSSFASGSVVSNEVAVGSPDRYHGTPSTPRGHHHRNKSSTSSYTGSSGTPYTDPDYDSPATTRSTGTVVHNPTSASRGQRRLSGVYNTALVAPSGFSSDYNDYADRSGSSHTSSGVSSSTRRAKDQDQSRRKSDERRKQEDLDREVAAALASEENRKQVRFEVDRAESRAKERAENLLAEKEKQRAEDREEERRRKAKERLRKDDRSQIAQPPSRKPSKSKPLATDFIHKRPGTQRRQSTSMTRTEIEEQKRLLEADLAYMPFENQAAEAREREERSALLRQQQPDISKITRPHLPESNTIYRQQQPEYNASLRQQQQETSYYNPREGMSHMDPPLGRSNSMSRRGSISGHRRASIVQPNPPIINPQAASNHAHLPSTRKHEPPPVSFPNNFSTRTRRPSLSSQENQNPFMTTSALPPQPPAIHQDPWDSRSMQDALPGPYSSSSASRSDGRYTMQRRGEDVINAAGTHYAARQATLAMGRVSGYEHDNAIEDSSDEVTHGHARRR